MASSAHSVEDLRHDLDETNGVINILEGAASADCWSDRCTGAPCEHDARHPKPRYTPAAIQSERVVGAHGGRSRAPLVFTA